MHRVQIFLEEWQYEQMKKMSERDRRSLSSLVRDAVSAFLNRPVSPSTALAEIAGIGGDPDARGHDHDDVLYRPRRSRT